MDLVKNLNIQKKLQLLRFMHKLGTLKGNTRVHFTRFSPSDDSDRQRWCHLAKFFDKEN